MTASPLDIVYTWVDATRPDYLELLNRYADTPRDLNPERFRDDLQFLRYSLRSLERYFPAAGRIFLFTARPQFPSWLQVEHPRLHLVHHDEVGAPDGTLPTFNSNVIDSLLHRIPDLGDRFLYLTDDCLFGAPATLDDFVAPDGRVRIFGTWFGEVFRRRVYQQQFFSFGLLEHGPLFIDKQTWGDMQAAVPEDIAELHRHRFRSPTDLCPDRLYRWFSLRHRRDRSVAEPCWRFLPKSSFKKLSNRLSWARRQLNYLRRHRPKFYCMNDDLGDQPDPAVLAEIRRFLEEQYPTPSSFERPPA